MHLPVSLYRSSDIYSQPLGLIVSKRFEDNIQGNLVPMQVCRDGENHVLRCQLFDGNNEIQHLSNSPEILVILSDREMKDSKKPRFKIRGRLNIIDSHHSKSGKAKFPPPLNGQKDEMIHLEILIKRIELDSFSL